MESLVEATSGAVGSLLSTTILYPLDTCKTKFQAENKAHQHQKYRFPLFSSLSRILLFVATSFLMLIEMWQINLALIGLYMGWTY